MTGPRLKILLLGAPQATWEGQPLKIPRRVTRMLLFYLAARDGTASRAELISVLWQELDTSLGRQRLRETLNKLRSALPDPSLLITSGDLVRLNLDQVYVDLIEFNRLVTQAGPQVWKIPADQPLPEQITKPLTKAVLLWRSPSFMASADILNTLSMDEWFRLSAEQYEHLLVRITERLSDHEITAGNPETAMHLVEIALVSDPYSEPLLERKLRLLIHLGRPLEAKQQYQAYRSNLFETTGLAPGAGLQALGEQLDQKNSLLPHATQKLHWEVRPGTQTVFVGRQRYLSILRQAYFRSKSMILLGESGQGKTRLLEEFAASLKPAPLIFLAKCRANYQSLPLQPLIESLRQSTPAAVWKLLPRAVVRQLAPMFPDLLHGPPTYAQPGSASGGQSGVQLFEALRQVFLSLDEHTVPLLVVDDAQWADETTLAALATIMQTPPFSTRGMVLVSARVEEQNHILRQWIAAQPPTVQVLHLGALNLREITTLATNVLGYLPPPHLVQRLAHETGGNTFFILEILHALAGNLVDAADNPEAPLPLAAGINVILQNRLSLLNPDARRFLEAAAVTGSEFLLDVACHACGLSKTAAAEALTELEERYLVEPASMELPDASYRFIHDKIREALLHFLNPLRLQVLHSQVAEAILAHSTVQADQRAAELANHFELAGDWERAFPWWVRAMERARALGAKAEAAEVLQRAGRIIESHFDQLDEELVCQLYQSWSVICHVTHEITALQEASARLMQLGDLHNRRLLKGSAYLILTALNLVQTQFAAGESNAQRAVDYLEGSGDLFQLTYARAALGLFQYLHNKINLADQTFETAIVEIQNPSNQRELMARGHIYYHLGLLRMLKGWPKVGCMYSRMSLEDNQAISLQDGIINGYASLTISSYFCGELQSALEASQSGLEMALQYQSLRMIGYLYTYRGMVMLALGNLDEFRSHTFQAIEINLRYRHFETLFTDYRILGDAYLFLRDYPRSLLNLEQSQKGGPDLFLAPDYTFRYHTIRYLIHREEEDRIKLEQVRRRAEELGLGMVAIVATGMHIILAAVDQQWEQVAREASELLDQCQTQGARLMLPLATNLLAMAELNLGQEQQAIVRLESLLSPDAPTLHAWTEVELSTTLIAALKRAGSPTEAVRQSLESRLAELARHCTHPDFLPSFEAYRKRVLQAADDCQPLSW